MVLKFLTSTRVPVSSAALILAPLKEAFGREELGAWARTGVASSVPRLASNARRPIIFGTGS